MVRSTGATVRGNPSGEARLVATRADGGMAAAAEGDYTGAERRVGALSGYGGAARLKSAAAAAARLRWGGSAARLRREEARRRGRRCGGSGGGATA
jgi:hypothetical protein